MTMSLIPETAPFTAEQRAWLNGFLAGWMGLAGNGDGSATTIPSAVDVPSIATLPETKPDPPFPWHNPNLTIVERLKLSEGFPLERRLMSAMAQLDCGSCGYVCKTYSEAIASGKEKNLALCSPGGKNTAKAIKQLLKEAGATNGNGSAATNGGTKTVASPPVADGHTNNGQGYSRANPFFAKLKSLRNLNKPGSTKHTTHAVIDLSSSGLSYRVGDALGVYPTNAPSLVDSIIAAARFDRDKPVKAPNGHEITLHDALRQNYCLRSASEELLSLLLTRASVGAERRALEASLENESFEQFDVLDALELAPSAQLSESDLLKCLAPLAPRLYSIASSIQVHPDEVHVTVGRIAYPMKGRERFGVASTMFADRLQPGDEVGVFIHAASDFTVPDDPSAAMIMVGPGTGIAPFRAFLEERRATRAPGKNWLFFGDQCAATDFLYQEEFAEMHASGLLTRLDTAFSRDQAHKIYVQDRMREHAVELFRWLEEGAHFYVCGDAQRMAVDVDRALHEIIATRGQRTAGEADAYLQDLKRQKRYVRDVY
jgi:sulfite reductase (NADPH) flavoprotein alpha-component